MPGPIDRLPRYDSGNSLRDAPEKKGHLPVSHHSPFLRPPPESDRRLRDASRIISSGHSRTSRTRWAFPSRTGRQEIFSAEGTVIAAKSQRVGTIDRGTAKEPKSLAAVWSSGSRQIGDHGKRLILPGLPKKVAPVLFLYLFLYWSPPIDQPQRISRNAIACGCNSVRLPRRCRRPRCGFQPILSTAGYCPAADGCREISRHCRVTLGFRF